MSTQAPQKEGAEAEVKKSTVILIKHIALTLIFKKLTNPKENPKKAA